VSAATPQSYIAAPLLNACIPSSVAFSVYDSKFILSDFKALHFTRMFKKEFGVAPSQVGEAVISI